MNKFNLTFRGEIIAGHDPAEVRSRFGKLYSIDDPARLERFFSGETIILRRNMDRKEAARCYHELHLSGAIAELVKVTTSDKVNELVRGTAYAQPSAKKAAGATKPSTVQSANEKFSSNRPAKTNRAPASSTANTIRNTAQPAASNGAQQAPAKKQRDTADIAAAIKLKKRAAAEQVAAELAAAELAVAKQVAELEQLKQAALAEQHRLAQQEAKRLAEEVAAQRAAQEYEARRKAAEEAARRQAAELAAARQREAAEAERRAAEAAAIKQRMAEEAARKAAEEAAIKQRKAEEAARKAAEEAAIKQRMAEEAARKAAEEAAIKQRKAEEEARIKAAKAEARRKAAEAEAQRKAQLKREKEERARLKADEAARQKAELQAQQRRQAEERARRKAEQAELERRATEEDARLRAELAAIKQRDAAAAARLQTELEEKTCEAAAQGQLTPAREQTGPRIALPLRPPAPVKAKSKSTLGLPQRSASQDTDSATILPRKRQPGEPNLYQLRPFRANEDVRSRAERAQWLKSRCYAIGLIALAALLLALGNYMQRTTAPVINGARATAVPPREGPLLLVGDKLLFHDRGGNSTRTATLGELQLVALEPPLEFDSEGVLYARGRLASSESNGNEPNDSSLPLLRCAASLSACRVFSTELSQRSIDAFVLNPLDNSLLLADAHRGQLLKVDRDGRVRASAAITLPPQPVLRLQGGLLLINSATAPALSVLRYEDNAFGQQLDEILLLPPAVTEAEQLRIGNFLWSGDAWWVSLQQGESGAQRLYRFDDEWNYINELALPHLTDALHLTAWGEKTLVGDAQHLAIERFNTQGTAEAQFVSSTLDTMKTEQQRRFGLSNTAWHSGLVLCAIIATLGLGLGYLNTLRRRVYQVRRESGAEPIDVHVDKLQWIDPVAYRASTLRRTTMTYALLELGVLALAIALSVTVTQLAALLIALSGPLLALLWLGRKPIGNLGTLDERLVLVDHSGMYHIAGGSRIQHCGAFLCIDDVVVFSGTRVFPAFSPAQVKERINPLALGGVKVDYRTVLVKLVESRHPLAVCTIAILSAAAAALLMLSWQGIY